MMCDDYARALIVNRKKRKVTGGMLNFDSRAYTDAEEEAITNIKEAASDLGREISCLLIPSREKSLALTKLEEAVMWAGKCINVNGVIGE